MEEYIVYEERYFCRFTDYWRGRKFYPAVVMRVDVENGGDPTMIDRYILVEAAKAREATSEDCKRFKIRID